MGVFAFLTAAIMGICTLSAWKHWIKHNTRKNDGTDKLENRIRLLEEQLKESEFEKRIAQLEEVMIYSDDSLEKKGPVNNFV